MANLSNINNKFIVTDGGQALVNQTVAGFNPDADDLIVGNLSGNTGITIASGSSAGNYGSIYFADGAGSSTPSKAGYIRYEQNTSKMTIGINAVEKVAIDLNGNVKIGNSTTGTPAVNADNLVIDKGASESGITIISTAAASIRFGDAANTSIGSVEYNHNSDYMRMIVNNAERMRIDSSGRVGIGTSDIEETLTIAKTDGGDGTIVGLRSDASFSQFELVTKNSQVDWGLQTIGARNMYFTTNGSERMRIDSSGNTTITTTLNQGGITATSAQDNVIVGISNTGTNGQAWRLQSTGGSSGLGAGKLFLKVGGTETAANLISFVTDGSGADIKMGIGTTNPETPLHVLTNTTDNASTMLIQNGSTGDASIKFNISGDTYSIGIDNSDSDKFKLSYGAVGTNDRIVVDTSGNVGIGTTAPAAKLHISGTSTQLMLETPNSTNDIDFRWRENGTNKWNIRYQNATEDLQILNQIGPTIVQMHFESSDSRIGIGNVSPTGRLTIEDGIGNQLHLRHSSTASGKYWNFDVASDSKLYIVNNGGTGVYIADGATSWTANSDESLKENIKPLNNVLDKIKDYRCVEYNLKTDKDKKIGFIAQDWENDFAPIVDKNDKGLLGMKYTETIPVLLKAIQELKADNDILKSRIETLENK